jgi:hypothetical protein
LGWTKGRQPYVHGDLNGATIPSIARIKKEFVRLARKYDSPPATPPRSASTLAIGATVQINTPHFPMLHNFTGVIVALPHRRSPVVDVQGCRYSIARRFLSIVIN